MMVALWLLWAADSLERAGELLREGRLEEASAMVERATAEDRRSVPAWLLAGRIAMARQEPERALGAFETAVRLAPESAGAHFMLGFCHYVENEFTRALPVLERARQLAPRDGRTALFLALTLDGLARPAEARAVYEKAVALPGDRGEARVAYGRFLMTAGDAQGALRQMESAIAERDSRDARYELARIRLEREEWELAIEQGERALALAATGMHERQIHHLLARAYARAGDAERAAAHRRKFEQMAPRMVR
jgi:tetratricopeptide (TPR) repeat protein